MKVESGVSSFVNLCACSLATAPKEVWPSTPGASEVQSKKTHATYRERRKYCSAYRRGRCNTEDAEVGVAALAGSKCTVWRREHPRHHGEEMEEEGCVVKGTMRR